MPPWTFSVNFRGKLGSESFQSHLYCRMSLFLPRCFLSRGLSRFVHGTNMFLTIIALQPAKDYNYCYYQHVLCQQWLSETCEIGLFHLYNAQPCLYCI